MRRVSGRAAAWRLAGNRNDVGEKTVAHLFAPFWLGCSLGVLVFYDTFSSMHDANDAANQFARDPERQRDPAEMPDSDCLDAGLDAGDDKREDQQDQADVLHGSTLPHLGLSGCFSFLSTSEQRSSTPMNLLSVVNTMQCTDLGM
jgi:hypothetical protein